MADTVSQLTAVEAEPDRQRIERLVRSVLDGHFAAGDANVGGFAFMVWDVNGSSTCECRNVDGHIPEILIPDFVRNRLLAFKIESWTIDTVNEASA